MDIHHTTKNPQWQCSVPGVKREPIFKGDYSFNTGVDKAAAVDAVEYATFIALLALSVFIGIGAAWMDTKSLSIDDYLMVGRNVNVVIAGLSMAATYISSIFVSIEPLEIYHYSTTFIWLILTYILANLIAAECFMPVFHRLKLVSIHEYLEKRFSRGVRSMVAMLFILQTLCFCPTVMYLPSAALKSVTGFSLEVSLCSIGLVSTLYTSIGGTRAVLWADSFQTLFMIVGMFITAIVMNQKIGSFSDVLDSAERTNRLKIFDFRLDPFARNTFWSMGVATGAFYLGLYATNQTSIHRSLVCQTTRKAKQAIWLNVAVLIYLTLFTVYTGVYVSAFYEYCDPVQAGFVDSSTSIISLFMVDVLKGTSGLIGLYMAYLFSAALSTISSGINSISLVILEDYVRTFFSPRIRENRARILSQTTSALFGLITVELAFLLSTAQDLLEVTVLVTGCFFVPLVGCFCLGLLIPHANTKGAYAGTFVSLCTHVFYTIGRKKSGATEPVTAILCVSNCNWNILSNATRTKYFAEGLQPKQPDESRTFYHLCYQWPPFINILLCLLVGTLVSYFTGFQDPTTLDPRLVVPVFDVLFPFYYLPESFREKLRFGVKYTTEWESLRKNYEGSKDGKSRQSTEVPDIQDTDVADDEEKGEKEAVKEIDYRSSGKKKQGTPLY